MPEPEHANPLDSLVVRYWPGSRSGRSFLGEAWYGPTDLCSIRVVYVRNLHTGRNVGAIAASHVIEVAT